MRKIDLSTLTTAERDSFKARQQKICLDVANGHYDVRRPSGSRKPKARIRGPLDDLVMRSDFLVSRGAELPPVTDPTVVVSWERSPYEQYRAMVSYDGKRSLLRCRRCEEVH